jgi:hypothetical protein
MSPSLKYLMVSSMAARNASSDPRSSTVTFGALEVASMLLVMWAVAPVGRFVTAACCSNDLVTPADPSPGTPQRSPVIIDNARRPRTCSLPRHTIRVRID